MRAWRHCFTNHQSECMGEKEEYDGGHQEDNRPPEVSKSRSEEGKAWNELLLSLLAEI